MSDRATFLRAILDAPADDASRLVFADWLDEHGCRVGAVTAAFVRRQVWNKTPHPNVPLTTLAELEPFIGPLPHAYGYNVSRSGVAEVGYADGSRFFYRRGFLDEVHATLPKFLEWSAALFGAHPVTEVTLTGVEPYWNGAGWCWYDASRPPPHNDVPDAANLPGDLFDRVAGHVAGRSRWKGYPTRDAARDAALAALSRACVAFGRSLAAGWTHEVTTPCTTCRGAKEIPYPERDEYGWETLYRTCPDCRDARGRTAGVRTHIRPGLTPLPPEKG